MFSKRAECGIENSVNERSDDIALEKEVTNISSMMPRTGGFGTNQFKVRSYLRFLQPQQRANFVLYCSTKQEFRLNNHTCFFHTRESEHFFDGTHADRHTEQIFDAQVSVLLKTCFRYNFRLPLMTKFRFQSLKKTSCSLRNVNDFRVAAY